MFDSQSPPKVFLTHSWQDRDIEFAKRLYNDLKAQGFDLWFDGKTLKAGQRLAEEINRALEWCSVYIPILSPAALGSQWCLEEINAAINLSNEIARGGRPRIVSVVAENCGIPPILKSRLYIKFAGRQYEEAWQELLLKGFGEILPELEKLYQAGTYALLSSDWEKAKQAFQSIVNRDPYYHDAILRLREADRSQREKRFVEDLQRSDEQFSKDLQEINRHSDFRNRFFIVVSIGLVGLLLIGLICIGGVFVIQALSSRP